VVGGTGPVLARTNRVQPWLLGASARRSAIAAAAILVAPFLASVPAHAAGLVGGALAASMSTLAAITPAIRDDSKVASSPGLLAAMVSSRGEQVREGTIEPKDTIGKALAREGLAPVTIATIQRQLKSTFDFRRARAGHTYRLVLDSAGALESFHYKVSATEHYWLERQGKNWRAWREESDVRREQKRVTGVVSTSLHDSIEDRVGPSNERLAQDFAGIFAWDLDFSRGVQPGDQYGILYERTFAPQGKGQERSLGPGRILAAQYRGAGGEFSAVYFETEPGEGGYYRPDGTSVQGAFLAAPLNFSRITSAFSYARFHPILRRTRPHLGVDYAAPVGTPIWSVANGVVSYAGWMRGYGRIVKIQHADGYETFYTHLSRFANGLRVGQPVRQKQVIGFVGSSGLATGPHTCFRITKDGSYVDPLRVRVEGRGNRIPQTEWAAFKAVRDRRLGALGPAPIVATDEAM
jgi:murein DD-endopeptidase MepM/ murein hydrolase activator NlpD